MKRDRFPLSQQPQIQEQCLEVNAVPAGFIVIPVPPQASGFGTPSVGVPDLYRLAYERAIETVRSVRYRRMILLGTGCYRWN